MSTTASTPHAQRLALLLGLFAHQGRHGGYGQKQLARDMQVSPQALRRRAKLAREGQAQAMTVTQLHQLAQLAYRELRTRLRHVGRTWQEIAAWLQGIEAPGTAPPDEEGGSGPCPGSAGK